MHRISKEVVIEASHCLSRMPDDHPCKRLHGHTYRIRVSLYSETLCERGFVVDFGAISALIKQYDHQYLGDDMIAMRSECSDDHPVEWHRGKLPDGLPATAEVFARVLYDQIQVAILNPLNLHTHESSHVRLDEVVVCETLTSEARFSAQ
jgi:6-pyruvoyltetrahydropterin/6-carboxytetrahydropterin synthase